MSAIQRVFVAHLLVAVAALAVGYARAGQLLVSLVIVLLGTAWVFTQQRLGNGLTGILLFLFILAGAVGFLFMLPGWLLLIAVVAALGAWDLDHFLKRLNAVERVDFASGVGREHLRRLGMVEGLGILDGLLGLTFRFVISFWWEALIVLLGVICIWAVVRFVRKQMGE